MHDPGSGGAHVQIDPPEGPRSGQLNRTPALERTKSESPRKGISAPNNDGGL